MVQKEHYIKLWEWDCAFLASIPTVGWYFPTSIHAETFSGGFLIKVDIYDR